MLEPNRIVRIAATLGRVASLKIEGKWGAPGLVFKPGSSSFSSSHSFLPSRTKHSFALLLTSNLLVLTSGIQKAYFPTQRFASLDSSSINFRLVCPQFSRGYPLESNRLKSFLFFLLFR